MSTFSLDRNNNSRADVDLLKLGDTFPAQAGPLLRQTGWRGGVFVQYIASNETDLFVVERSDGNTSVGFILNASEDNSYDGPGSNRNWTSQIQRGNAASAAAGCSTITIVSGGPKALFAVYETVALTGGGTRTGGPITYSPNDPLRISENGLLCNDSEANLIAAGIAAPIFVGNVIVPPSERSGNRLGLDMKF